MTDTNILFELGWVVGLRPIVRMCDLGLRAVCPLWGFFWMILSHIYSNFGGNYTKLQIARSTSVTENRTSQLPPTSFQGIITRPLVEQHIT